MAEFVEEFRDVNAELRLLVTLTPTAWDIQYIADPLEELYSDRDFEESYRQMMANQVSSDNLSQVVQAGEFVGQVYVFENVVVYQFPSSRYEGVFVSYNRKDSFPALDIIETAEQIPAIE